LSKPFDAFPQPSQATKTAFEQKTSAINVTPSSSPRYEIKEIKEDALWLSKIANIDELSALRVVIEECQSRTAAQLLGRFSEEELISIGEAAGNSKYSSPIPVCLLSEGLDLEAIQKDFDLEDNRRQRIFRAYLSERRHLLKSTERLLHIVLNPDQAYGNGTGKATEVKTSWLASHGRTVASKLGPTDDFLLRCFKAIRGNVKNIENGSGWQDDVELEWVRAQITEATHSMEIVFQMVDSARECTSSKVVLEWLRLADSCGFFSSFEMVCAPKIRMPMSQFHLGHLKEAFKRFPISIIYHGLDIADALLQEEPSVQALLLPLQSLTTIISLTVFSLGSCIAYLSDARESPEVSTSVDVPYIFNSLTMADIHSILTNAAEVGLVTAGPAILAWSALLQTLRIRITDSKAAQLEGKDSPHFNVQ
jgi:nuclear pore complex protein Nup188